MANTRSCENAKRPSRRLLLLELPLGGFITDSRCKKGTGSEQIVLRQEEGGRFNIQTIAHRRRNRGHNEVSIELCDVTYARYCRRSAEVFVSYRGGAMMICFEKAGQLMEWIRHCRDNDVSTEPASLGNLEHMREGLVRVLKAQFAKAGTTRVDDADSGDDGDDEDGSDSSSIFSGQTSKTMRAAEGGEDMVMLDDGDDDEMAALDDGMEMSQGLQGAEAVQKQTKPQSNRLGRGRRLAARDFCTAFYGHSSDGGLAFGPRYEGTPRRSRAKEGCRRLWRARYISGRRPRRSLRTRQTGLRAWARSEMIT